MGSTYLELTNRVLRKLNEVELTSSTFTNARGIHAAAKDAVRDAVRIINHSRFEWPFNAVEHTQTLITGRNEYAWPTGFKIADWESFQIQKSEVFNIQNRNLKVINRDEWYKKFKDLDDDSGNIGRAIPDFCFESFGTGWGVSPRPERDYTIKFRYYSHPDDLTNYDHITTIPSEFDYVITLGALYYMNMFKDNIEGVQFAKAEFQKGINDMDTILINKLLYIYDGRVNYGGGT